MKQLDVVLLQTNSLNASINELSFFLDSAKRNALNQTPWAVYKYTPVVDFAIGYGPDCIFLKYYVNEKSVRAVNSSINGSVWEDSCVELFISFENERAYYNFEFNCIGTALVGYGERKADRELLPDELISRIKYQAVINNDQPGNDLHWELTIAIPFTLFCHNNLDTLKGQKCRANFYKCGDLLPTPHFLAWSNINWPEPNFHLPEFFGSLHFV